jgi:succinate-semialdehyde dehydrogenase/glutarate-semialdehyde dehydrogenase
MNAPLAKPNPTEAPPLQLSRTGLFRQAAYIDGAWVDSEATLEVINPATGLPLGVVPAMGEREALAAVDAATRALPAWRAQTAKARSEVLRRWFDLMMAHQEDLARLLTAEQGKPLAEARTEIAYSASFLEWFAEEGRRAYGELIPSPATNLRLSVSKEPVGVVSAITPWNFPSAMITRKVGPALAAGCAIVLKPSELTPFSAIALAVLAQEAGVPPGVFNIVTGPPKDIGAVLTDDPRIAKFTFTGSTAVGKMLAARCMATLKRVSLELGGNAPFIVFDDADLDAAINGAMHAKFRNAGQTCISANRFLVQRGVQRDFAERLAARAEALVVGDGLAGPTDQGPLINAAAVAKVARHVDLSLGAGAKLLTGGGRLPSSGTFFQPTVLTDLPPDTLLNSEETFGPLAGVVPFDDEAEAIAIANDTRSGLAAYFFSHDIGRITRVNEALAYGMVAVNTSAISSEVAPFGGVKESGIGREGSRHGLDEYLNLKLTALGI